jgi:glycosyltransferase involved in cell wall biosynthesis
MSKKIVFIKSNSLDIDVRVPKETRILRENYFNITFLGWNRELRKTGSKITDSSKINQVLMNLKAPYGKKIILYIPIWWFFEFFWLISHRWDIVHVVNLDSLLPAFLVAKIKNKKIIYEILDTYEDLNIIPKLLRDFIISIDKIFMKNSDIVILVDENQIQEFNGIPNNNAIVLYDSPPDLFTKDKIKNEKWEEFTLFYAGVLFKERNLNIEKIIQAVQEIDNVQLIIAGYGNLVDDIKYYSSLTPNKIKYIGILSNVKAMEMCAEATLMFQLREPTVLINKYICGSTLLNAMMCGTPILVNKGTSTAEKVLNENCGLVINANNVEEIKNAIIKLRDDSELRTELGKNGRRAYVNKYNWEIMENKLLDIYYRFV